MSPNARLTAFVALAAFAAGCSETLSSPGNGEIVTPLRLNEWQALHGRDAGVVELRFRDPTAPEGVLGDDTDADITTFDLKRDLAMTYNFLQRKVRRR